jgi:hypothetical protein
MGTHISKVKSLSLDKWDKQAIKHIASFGNCASNTIHLARLHGKNMISEHASPV